MIIIINAPCGIGKSSAVEVAKRIWDIVHG